MTELISTGIRRRVSVEMASIYDGSCSWPIAWHIKLRSEKRYWNREVLKCLVTQTTAERRNLESMSDPEVNLREKVFDHVRSEIVSGQARPGSMYSVPSLAESFGISTTPVREALLELARGGFLEPHRNRGFRVTMPSVEETRHIFDMREVLEVYAGRIVATLPKRDFPRLRPLADSVAAAIEKHSYSAYLTADHNFHRALIDAAGNPILTQTIFSLRDRIRFYGEGSSEGVERQKASIDEHYRIVSLVSDGDADGLATLLKTHIRSWEPLFMKAVATFEQPRGFQRA